MTIEDFKDVGFVSFKANFGIWLVQVTKLEGECVYLIDRWCNNDIKLKLDEYVWNKTFYQSWELIKTFDEFPKEFLI